MSPQLEADLNLQKLSEGDVAVAESILQKLTPVIEEKQNKGNLATLSFEEIYAPLNDTESTFLKEFQSIDPIKAGIKTAWQGLADGNVELIRVEGQRLDRQGEEFVIPPQFVPPDVYKHYLDMMQAMQNDLGRRLYIESGYRSSAYQLYLFLFYLKNHDYSIFETARWNAFPGYSEHGNPARQALDFINEKGINGEDDPASFESLPEYSWLVKHAQGYGFVLSFPKNDASGIAFEPWHWHFEKGVVE